MEQISESIRQGQESRASRTRQVKQFVLALISIGVLSLDWWLISEALYGNHSASFWAWPVAVAAIWISVASMLALTKPAGWVVWVVNVLGLAAFVALMPKEPLVLIGGVLFVVLSWFFYRRVQDEETNQLNFSFRRVFANSQNIITYALLILVGFLLYSNVDQDFNRDKEAFYNRIAEVTVRGLPFLTQDANRFDLGQSVREFFASEAERQYPVFNQVNPQNQEYYIDLIQQQFSEQYGVNVNQNQSLRFALTEVVSQRLQDALGPYDRFLPLFFTVAIIVLLRSVAFVFNWATLFVSWLVYRLLLSAKFFRLSKETVEVEKLVI
jgi:hypothetical protein